MPPALVRWISSYLTDRRQRVTISNSQFTSWKSVSSGVPQGSVLGPLLFAFLASGFIPASANSACVMYADDMTILHHVTATSGDSSQNELSHLKLWADQNALTINPCKTKVLDVGNMSAAPRSPIQLAQGAGDRTWCLHHLAAKRSATKRVLSTSLYNICNL